jgi:hypothetical protein
LVTEPEQESKEASLRASHIGFIEREPLFALASLQKAGYVTAREGERIRKRVNKSAT